MAEEEETEDRTALIAKFAAIHTRLNSSQQTRFSEKQSALNTAFAATGVERTDEETLIANIAAAQAIIDQDAQAARDDDNFVPLM